MVQSWNGGWNIWVYAESAWESLYEWLQNYFKTKEPIGREWCTILQKARTANPSATTMPAVAQWQMSCLWKDLNTRKQHVENISQMCVKNSWGEAHYHASCRRDYTREDDRHPQTIKNTKTIAEQASNKTILTLFSVHRPVCYGQNRLEIKRLPREGRIMKLEHSMHLLCRGK